MLPIGHVRHYRYPYSKPCIKFGENRTKTVDFPSRHDAVYLWKFNQARARDVDVAYTQDVSLSVDQ